MKCIKCGETIKDDFTFCPFCGKKQVKGAATKPKKRANGTGTVFKAKGRRSRPWVAKCEGKLLGYFAQKSEADLALEQALLHGIPDRFNATVGDIYKQWFDAKYAALSASSQQQMDVAWSRLNRWEHLKMRELRKAHLQQIVNEIAEAGLSRSVCEKFRILCSHLCRLAMEEEILNKNYAQLLDLPSGDSEEKEIFTAEEINRLKLCSADKDVRIILVMALSGVRPNELFKAKIEDIHIGNQNFMIGGSKTAAGRNRIIPLHSYVIPFITDWIGDRTEGLLLPSSTGREMILTNWRKRGFLKALELAGIDRDAEHKLTPYSCRHTFATNMMRHKTRAELLAKIMGHEDYKTTVDNYGHVTDEDIKEMCEAVNAL